MTLNDLVGEVAALAFENEAAIDEAFMSALRRALKTIYNEKSIMGTYKMFQEPIYPSKHYAKIEHGAGETIRIDIRGFAYSFKVCGHGEYAVYHDNSREAYSFGTSYGEYSGYLIGEGYIEFFGDFDYTVYDLCFFDKLSALEIPFLSSEREYKLSEIIDDFLGYASLPTDEKGKEIKGARIIDDRLILPYDYNGTVVVRYRKAPPEVSEDEPTETIMIPKDVEHLPALLTASYLCLEDEPEQAMHYLSLYREAMAAVKLYGKRDNAPSYRDVLGWA